MIKKLLILLVLLMTWTALLWFAIGIDINAHGNAALAAMHLLPPLTLWAGWWAWSAWRERKQAADKTAEAEAKRAALEKQRAESRAKFDKELAERRAWVAMRWLQVRDLKMHGEAARLTATVDGVAVLLRDEEMVEIVEEAPDEWPGVQLTELFVELLTQCPAALALPVYLLGPSDQAFAALAERVRSAREAALLQLDQEWPAHLDQGAVLGLPQSAASPQELIDLCANQPELPGAVVLAFESPLSIQTQRDEEEELSDAARQREQWFGKAGQALVGMLLTSPALPGALMQLNETAPYGAATVMTPYWDRTQLAPGMVSFLAALPDDWRQALADLPMIAQLHRPAWLALEEKTRPTQFSQNMRRLLELAGVNAALVEPSFDAADDAAGEADAAAKAPSMKLTDSAWLVHNAGGISVCGNRLAGIGLAMSDAGMDLGPVNEGTNVAVHAGDCGRATPYLMLSLAAAKAAELQKPALVTHFHERQVAMSFVLPPSV